MKLFTQEEFDNFPIVDGYKQCPSGDYMLIKKFEDYCRFGESCKFGEYCEFGNDCTFREECTFGFACIFGRWCFFTTCKIGQDSSFGECCVFEGKCIIENEHITKNQCPLLIFSGFGTVRRTTYFFNCKDGIFVRCGCFFGDIKQFREQVKKTRTGIIKKEYLMIADLVEMKWK